MPSLNVTFTEAELDEIRTASADSSLKSYVHDQVLKAARNRKALVEQMAKQVAATSAELNSRLA
jgi:hypothetical protein